MCLIRLQLPIKLINKMLASIKKSIYLNIDCQTLSIKLNRLVAKKIYYLGSSEHSLV